MYTSKTPQLLKNLASDVTWNMPRSAPKVYLTFDDGPTEGVTDKVLDVLNHFDAKASFFCVGEMVQKNPILFKRIKEEGHSIGNHTMKHESGWFTNNYSYLKSFLRCNEVTNSNLFRPPYGRITRSQAKAIKSRSEIVMWDVLPGDFDDKIKAEVCVERIKKNTQNGSIIVLHDSQKCGEKMLQTLPEAVRWLTERFELSTL